MSLVVVIFGTPPIVTKLMAMMFGPAFVRKQPAAARDIQAHLAALPRRTLRAVWGVIMRGAVSDADLRAIQCPVLIVHGELDASVPIEHARETAARLPSLAARGHPARRGAHARHRGARGDHQPDRRVHRREHTPPKGS